MYGKQSCVGLAVGERRGWSPTSPTVDSDRGGSRPGDVWRRDVLPGFRRFAVHVELQHPRLLKLLAVHLAFVLGPPVEQDPCRVQRIGMADQRHRLARMLAREASHEAKDAAAHHLDRFITWQETALCLVDKPHRTAKRDLPEGHPLQIA